MTRLFCNFVVAVASWVWLGRTVSAWAVCCDRLHVVEQLHMGRTGTCDSQGVCLFLFMVSQGGTVQGDSCFLTSSLEKQNTEMAAESYSSPHSLKLVSSEKGNKINSVRIVEYMWWELFIWAGQKFTPWGSGWLALLQVPGFVEKRKTENILNHLFPSCSTL